MDREDREAVARAVACVAPHYREAIDLRFWQSLSYQEIGARMGYSPEAARKLVVRAMRAVAPHLKSLGPEDR